jgi:DNA-binding NarL/FixJ family response regulator
MEHLSPREYIVARLVSMGNTDREIAQKLRLSVRTIESVLASVYSKLEISTREQLASLLPKAAKPAVPFQSREL